MIYVLIASVAAVWSIGAAVWDWRTRRLPNALTLGGLGVAAALAFGLSVEYGLASLVTGLFASLFLLVPYLVRATGAGDVKMMAAAGVFAGPEMTLPLVFAVSAAGIVLAVVMLVFRKVNGARLKHILRTLFDPRYDRKAGKAALPPRESEACRVPFGVAIAAGLVIVHACKLLPLFVR